MGWGFVFLRFRIPASTRRGGTNGGGGWKKMRKVQIRRDTRSLAGTLHARGGTPPQRSGARRHVCAAGLLPDSWTIFPNRPPDRIEDCLLSLRLASLPNWRFLWLPSLQEFFSWGGRLVFWKLYGQKLQSQSGLFEVLEVAVNRHQFEVVAHGESREVGVGPNLGRGGRKARERRSSACKARRFIQPEDLRKGEQGPVSLLPGGGVTGTEGHAHEPEFYDGGGWQEIALAATIQGWVFGKYLTFGRPLKSASWVQRVAFWCWAVA